MTGQHPDQRDAERVRFDIFKNIDRLRLSAWLTIAFERLWPLVLPTLLVIALFVIFAWFGIFRSLPDLARLGLLALFVLSLPVCLYILLKFRLPDHAEVSRHLEDVNTLDHQPIAVQSETIATSKDDPFAQALWDEHRKRMAERIKGLRSGLPRTNIPEIDPWGLRAVVGLLLVIAFAFSGGPLGGRLSDAFKSHSASNALPPRIDAWVTPPRYTGRPPVFLTSAANNQEKQFTVPQNSTLVIRIIGGTGSEKVTKTLPDGKPTEVAVKDAAKPEEATAAKDQPRNFEVALETNTAIKLTDSSNVDSEWAFTVLPDQPPTIHFTKEPSSAVNGTMELTYEIKDDYGAASAQAKVEQIAPPAKDARPLYAAPEIPLSLPKRGAQGGDTKTTKDLTEHVWAGSEIRITLLAVDDAKQEARSETRNWVMPERPFSNPLARAVVEQRRVLALNANTRTDVLNMLDAITLWPEETIKNPTHYLALRSIRSRLNIARSDDQLRDVVAYMWQVARGIEDGALSEAERSLREAEEALRQAIEQNASPEEIEKRMADLRKAMNKYMRELAQQAQRNPKMAQADPNARELRQEDIDRILKQIEELAKQGSKEQAQQLLEQLNDMLNNLQMRQAQGKDGQGDSMKQQMNKLGDLMRRQQQTMNETHRLEQQRQNGMMQDNGQMGQDGQQGQMSEEEIAKALKGLQEGQGKLQSDLQQLMDDLNGQGITPNKDFGEAGKSMGEAKKSLGDADSGQALDQQSNALDSLRKGGQDMMKQMQAMGQTGKGKGEQGGLDPLGRPQGKDGTSSYSDVDRPMLPGEADIQRAKQILDAIRQRLGNALSPQMEKDYLERLLKFD